MNISVRNVCRNKTTLVGGLVVALLFTGSVYATNGYIPHGIGLSKSLAEAGTALPLDSLTGLRNPGAMVRVGRRLDADFSLFMPNREYKANNDFQSPPFAFVPPGTEESRNDYFLIPSFGVNWKVDDRSTIGLSIVPQGGLNTEYGARTFQFFAPPGAPGEFQAGQPTGVDLMILVTGVTFARELFPGHSIGLTPIFAAQRFKARGLQPFKALSTSPNNVTNNGYDYSYGGGFAVGWLGEMHERVDLGVSYQSRLWMTDFGDYKGLFAKGGEFDIPPIINAGVAVKVTENITVLGDYQNIFFGDIKALNNTNDPAGLPAGNQRLGGSEGLGFGWNDVDIWKLGVQWQFRPSWTARAGYSWGEEPWDGPNTLFNILAPATIEDHVSVGLTWESKGGHALSAGYTYAVENTIEGQSVFTGPQTGHVRMHQHMVDVGFSYKF